MDRARARARTGARIRLGDESGHVRNISRRIASPSPSPDQLPEHSNNKSKAGHGARSFAAAARGGGTTYHTLRARPHRDGEDPDPYADEDADDWVFGLDLDRAWPELQGQQRGSNGNGGGGGRRRRAWLVVLGSGEEPLVRGHGDDEPLLQPTLNRLFPMRVFRVFRLASLHDIRFHTVTTARSTSIVDGDCRHWDSESLLSGYYSPSPYDKYYVTDSALCCLTLQLSSHLLQCFRSL